MSICAGALVLVLDAMAARLILDPGWQKELSKLASRARHGRETVLALGGQLRELELNRQLCQRRRGGPGCEIATPILGLTAIVSWRVRLVGVSQVAVGHARREGAKHSCSLGILIRS